MIKVSILAISIAAATLAGANDVHAADEYNVSNGITLKGHPLGLHGVDPVSMFQSGAPVIGDAAFTVAVDGIDYYFADAATQKAFEADPQGFLPQYGGFCALGVSLGKKLDGDVRYADIVDGKLYLFVNAAIFEKYLANKDAVLTKAADMWPGIQHMAISDL